ncbi:MAG: M28 family metallopeptidase [Anaerolineae bacterium]|nr:M28 family metallopeptidase [Anaerolineae bacterium]
MSRIFEHLTTLTNFGPRPIGSQANQAAADFIAATFSAAGLQVEEQPYACTAWEEQKTLLEIDGEQLDCAANAFSPACDITAPLAFAGTLPELELATAKGKLLLLYGDLTRAPLSPKSWFLKDERDESIIQILEAMQPAALLAPSTATDYYGQLTEDWELDLPAATISAEAARRLAQNPGQIAHLCIEAERSRAVARNIVGRINPKAEKRLVLCAHFDTKTNTPGASDNGGGAAVLLGLAEHFSKLESGIGLEFVAFNGEEYLPMGDDEYLRRAESYFDSIQCAINMDGVGPILGSTSITAFTESEAFEAKVSKMAAMFPGVVWVEPWPESNHSTFAFRGIQALALSAVGTRALAHQPYDDLAGMSAARLEEVASLVEKIVTDLAKIPAK